MNGFSVTPAELRTAAAALHALVDECATQPAAKYRADPDELGDTELAAALAEFQRTSWAVAAVLIDDATELARRLSGTATAYETTDAEVADAFAAIDAR